jgi:hypothetical protein
MIRMRAIRDIKSLSCREFCGKPDKPNGEMPFFFAA